MTHEEAIHTALGYAWGAEDFGKTRTSLRSGKAEGVGPLDFAEAYADGWDAFNGERRGYMTNVADAYRRWQDSRGQTIFEPAYIPGYVTVDDTGLHITLPAPVGA